MGHSWRSVPWPVRIALPCEPLTSVLAPAAEGQGKGEDGKVDMNTADYAELVFGFVYGVGTDADPVITVLEHYLKQYRYAAEVFRISDQLRTLELGLSFDGASAFEKWGPLWMLATRRARGQRTTECCCDGHQRDRFGPNRR